MIRIILDDSIVFVFNFILPSTRSIWILKEWDKQIINFLYWCVYKCERTSCHSCWHSVNNSKHCDDIRLYFFYKRMEKKKIGRENELIEQNKCNQWCYYRMHILSLFDLLQFFFFSFFRWLFVCLYISLLFLSISPWSHYEQTFYIKNMSKVSWYFAWVLQSVFDVCICILPHTDLRWKKYFN
jgi:hypothetical protein